MKEQFFPPSSITPDTSNIIAEDWSPFQGKEHLVVNTSRSFKEAEKMCNKYRGGHLVSMHSDEKEQYIKELLR